MDVQLKFTFAVIWQPRRRCQALGTRPLVHRALVEVQLLVDDGARRADIAQIASLVDSRHRQVVSGIRVSVEVVASDGVAAAAATNYNKWG